LHIEGDNLFAGGVEHYPQYVNMAKCRKGRKKSEVKSPSRQLCRVGDNEIAINV
jgi:hypothetical protein